MHTTVILFVFFLTLSIAGILADIVLPRCPRLEKLIWKILDID